MGTVQEKPWWRRMDGLPPILETRSRRFMSPKTGLFLALTLILSGVILGAVVDADWYLRLIPFGIGLGGGALWIQREESK
jgi:hypothetical protein